MKSLLANPIRTSSQFAAGGDRIPIQTRSSGQSVRGFSTQGLPIGMTKLGAYRMGDSDGIAPPSAIYPGDIFGPIPTRDRQYPQVTFENVGNRVFQPEDDTHKLHALLKALGDQKFKYDVNAPFADYFAVQRLAKEADEASRNASLEDVGHARGILRNLVDTRRKQANDDYMRKMLDAGMSIENAEDEIENVRRSHALLEARKVEDRTYQSKILLSRLAQSRGITPNIQEPLTSTSAIEAPQRSQALSSMMGMPGEGFGTSPLDTSRQFLTPDFYRRFLRRSRLTQESGDEQAAIASLIAGGETAGDEVGTLEEYVDDMGVTRTKNIGNVTASAVTAASLSGASRENAIENIREMYASRVESMRKKKVLLPLPPILFGERVIAPLYSRRSKEPGDKARFSVEVYADLPVFQQILAINQMVSVNPDNLARLKRFLQTKVLTKNTARGVMPSDNIRDILAEAGNSLLSDSMNVRIPYVGENVETGPEMLVRILEEFQNLPKTDFDAMRRDASSYSREYESILVGEEIPAGERDAALGFVTPDNNTGVPGLTVVSTTRTGADGGGGGSSSAAAGGGMSEEELRTRLKAKNMDTLKSLVIRLGGSTDYKDKKKDLIDKVIASGRYTGVE